MVNSLQRQKLADLCESIDYGFTTSAKQEPVGPKFLRITDIVSGTINWNEVPFCKIDAKKKPKYKLAAGDVVIARTGATTGHSAFLASVPDAVFASYLVRLKIQEPHSSRFVGYYLKGRQFWDYMYGVLGDKSAQPNASATTLTQAPIDVPKPEVQEAIAHVLGTLDDKIELNRRMNRTLEKIAAAIFKSWFIDFDPVRAKAEGQDPGMPEEIVSLFPDSFKDSELGTIPEGWSVGPLAEVATLQTKTVQPGKQPETLWEHYSIPAFDEGRQPKWERGETIKSGKYAVPHNSVLASKLNPQFPRIWLPEIADSDVAICSTEFMPFVPAKDTWRPFLYELIKSPTVQDEIRSRVSGSTGSRQRVKPRDIAIMPVVIPKSEIIDAYCDTVEGMHKKLLSNRRNSLSLTRPRDRLLPQLLSGELELPATGPAEEVA